MTESLRVAVGPATQAVATELARLVAQGWAIREIVDVDDLATPVSGATRAARGRRAPAASKAEALAKLDRLLVRVKEREPKPFDPRAPMPF